MDRIEPADPIDKIDPAEPMDKIEPVEPMDKMDPLAPMLRTDPVEPSRRECLLFRMEAFSQQRLPRHDEPRVTLRLGPPALDQGERGRRALSRGTLRAPAGVVVAYRRHRAGGGQFEPDRPGIARHRTGEDSQAPVRVVGLTARAGDFRRPAGPGQPPDADHGLPLRSP
jgi:hypothetical protein